MNTYTPGFCIRPAADVSTHDFMQLCVDITNKFNTEYKTNEYLFVPEAKEEGGILMKNFPGKVNGMYKSMRIYFDNYPRFTQPNGWNQKKIIFHGGRWVDRARNGGAGSMDIASTYLRAFHNAPAWTIGELELIESIMQAYGITKHGKYPSLPNLIHTALTINAALVLFGTSRLH